MSTKRADRMEADEIFVNELRLRSLTKVLAANFTVDAQMPSVLCIDPTAARDVTMPAVTAQGMEGKLWIIINDADAAETITVKDAAAATIVAITQNDRALIMVCGGLWKLISLYSTA